MLSKDADCRWLPAGEGAHSSGMYSDINQLAGEPVRELLSRYSNMNFFNFIKHPLVGTPYGSALDLCIVLAIVCWVLSILTREYSWVDRLWSVVPAVYCLIVAVDLEFQSARVNIMTVLATFWGIRLTFNYALICLILSAR